MIVCRGELCFTGSKATVKIQRAGKKPRCMHETEQDDEVRFKHTSFTPLLSHFNDFLSVRGPNPGCSVGGETPNQDEYSASFWSFSWKVAQPPLHGPIGDMVSRGVVWNAEAGEGEAGCERVGRGGGVRLCAALANE